MAKKTKIPPSDSTSNPFINEPKKDAYIEYKKDPRLDTRILKKTTDHSIDQPNPLYEKIKKIHDEEELLDVLRLYKREHCDDIIETLEKEPFKNRQRILHELSQIADTIILATKNYIQDKLEQAYGKPSYLSSYKQTQPAHLAIIAMGKLGAQTLNYHSDLDLIFVYSNRGETHGKKIIDNAEFFVKLAQKFIHSLSIMTIRGRCYDIDTELRPSGHMGTLITSYDHFLDHQMNKSQHWERQALLRARPLCSDHEFNTQLNAQIEKLAFDRPLPNDFTSVMHHIREQVIKEKVKESKQKIDIKLGPGSLMDIEFILHNCQLKYAKIHHDLRQKSLFDLLETLNKYDILSKQELETMTQAHLTFRTIESQLHLILNRAASLIDFESETFKKICAKLNQTEQEFIEKILNFRKEVREIYKKVYK